MLPSAADIAMHGESVSFPSVACLSDEGPRPGGKPDAYQHDADGGDPGGVQGCAREAVQERGYRLIVQGVSHTSMPGLVQLLSSGGGSADRPLGSGDYWPGSPAAVDHRGYTRLLLRHSGHDRLGYRRLGEPLPDPST